MFRRTARRVGIAAASLSLPVALCLAGTAQAAPAGPAGAPAATGAAQPNREKLPAASPMAGTNTKTVLPATSPASGPRPAAALPAVTCPSGSTLVTDSEFTFATNPLPSAARSVNVTWVDSSGGGGTDGYLHTSITNGSSTNYAYYRQPSMSQGDARSFVQITYRGAFVRKAGLLIANYTAWYLDVPADPNVWTTQVIEVTGDVSENMSSYLNVGVANDPARAGSTATSTLDVDGYHVYQCTKPAVGSGKRADFDGDGIADMAFLDGNSALWMYPNAGTSGYLSSTAVFMRTYEYGATWIGNPGDMNGDGRADLLVRDARGDLYLRLGDGLRGFTSDRILVGTAWYGYKQIIPTGDLNNDGSMDMLGLTWQGDLLRFSLITGPNPRITNGVLIGTAFYGYRMLISSGDFNGDGVPDVLGITNDSNMYGFYTVMGSGKLTGHGIHLGTGWNMDFVSSPGDFNGNGYNDLLVWVKDGTLVTYWVDNGHWAGRTVQRTGFFPKLLA